MDDIFRKKLGRHGGHFLKGSGDAIVDFFGVNGGVKKKYSGGNGNILFFPFLAIAFCYNNKFGKNCGQARL